MKTSLLTRSAHPRSVLTRLVLAGVAVAALAACSSGSSNGSPAATVPANVGLEVIAGPGIKFDKSEYTAKAGSVTVAYVNRDSQRHTLSIVGSDGKALASDMEVLKSGAISTKDFTLSPGTYKLLCTVPGHTNMKATLTVS